MTRGNTNWRITYYLVFICWLLGAMLSMFEMKAGFVTNYLADLTFPAWFYIFIRGLDKSTQRPKTLKLFGTWFGRSPLRAFISIFLVGFASELYTYYFPNSIGVFDWIDIAAYFIGLLICFLFDNQKFQLSKNFNSSEKSK
jgi:hypothetical protein